MLITFKEFAGAIARKMERRFSILVLNINSHGTGFCEDLDRGNIGSCSSGNMKSSTPEAVNRVSGFSVEIDDKLYYVRGRIEADAGVKKGHAVEFRALGYFSRKLLEDRRVVEDGELKCLPILAVDRMEDVGEVCNFILIERNRL